MVVAHALNAVFIHVQRTGGTALINALQNESDGNIHIISQHDNARTISPDLLDGYPHYYTFGFVRNPWSRTLSWYLLLNKWNRLPWEEEQKAFEEFLEHTLPDISDSQSDHFFNLNQIDHFIDSRGDNRADFIGRYENYEQDCRFVWRHLGLATPQIPVVNESMAIDYRIFYTDKARDIVTTLCQRDIAHFGYSF